MSQNGKATDKRFDTHPNRFQETKDSRLNRFQEYQPKTHESTHLMNSKPIQLKNYATTTPLIMKVQPKRIK